MIVLTAIAGAVVLIAAVFAIAAASSFNKVYARRKDIVIDDGGKRCGIDVNWFETVKDGTERVEISAFDGVPLGGYLIRSAPNNKRVAIVMHGYGANTRTVQPYARIFFELGFDVLLPAARAHEISGGKHVGMAWLDRFDILRWIDKIISLYGEGVGIALYGISMGGSTVVSVAGMTPPRQVKCVIDDCGYSSLVDEFGHLTRKVPLPRAVRLAPLSLATRLKLGYATSDADVCALAGKAEIPALFIHGEADKFVPLSLGRKLFDAYACEDKRFVAFENAAHACSYITDGDKYREVVADFIGHVFAPEP